MKRKYHWNIQTPLTAAGSGHITERGRTATRSTIVVIRIGHTSGEQTHRCWERIYRPSGVSQLLKVNTLPLGTMRMFGADVLPWGALPLLRAGIPYHFCELPSCWGRTSHHWDGYAAIWSAILLRADAPPLGDAIAIGMHIVT